MTQEDHPDETGSTHPGSHGGDAGGRSERAGSAEFDDVPPFPDFAHFGTRPWPGGRRAGRGDVRAAILSLLANGPATGYGLMQAIREHTDGAWRPSSGSVYPTLQQLVDEDLIAPTGNGRRTDYVLTAAGRAHVATHADERDAAWRSTLRFSDADRELFRSVGRLISAAGQLRFASDMQRTAAIDRIDQTRRDLYRILAE